VQNNELENQQTMLQESLAQLRFAVSKDVLFRQVEHEAILLHLVDGMYYSLNETSIPFWEALRNRSSLLSAVEQVTSQYAVETDQVIQDLTAFLDALLLYKLITPIPSDQGAQS
jgi:hypothetical protein